MQADPDPAAAVAEIIDEIRTAAETLRPLAVAALEAAEAEHDGGAIVRASIAIGQIDALRATLAKDSGAPPPQRRPRHATHTPYSVPMEKVLVKRCPPQ